MHATKTNFWSHRPLYGLAGLIFLKWGISNVPFCSIFVPFHFYLIMTLVVPCLDSIFMVFLISALAKIGAMKPYFLDSGFPWGRWVRACVGMVCYHWIVHILNSSKNSIFFVSNSDLCRTTLPNYLRTYSSALPTWGHTYIPQLFATFEP